jgi:O-antigen/teichoic acid export membrane protein
MSAIYRRARGLLVGAFGASSPLVLSRLLSAALTFGLPLALVRLLEPNAFGTYKQFFLVVTTVLLIGQFGLTQSLYYFLPRGGAERGSYVSQALSLLWSVAALLGLGLYAAAPRVAGWVGSSELEAMRLPLATTAALMLMAAPLEGSLTSEGRIGAAAVAYVLTDALRAAALVAAAKWGIPLVGPSAIFWAATALYALRVVALVVLIARRILPWAPVERARLAAQLRFALPYAGATLLFVCQRYCSQYVVSARFDAATFALFTLASFHMPVVDIVFMPIAEVLIVQLGRTLGQDPRGSLDTWNDTIDKLASILFPAACGAWLLGPTLLPLLFTHRYAGAVPLFVLATFEIPICILPTDALLRAAGDTRFLFWLNALRVVMTLVLVLVGIHVGGLGGAIVGGILSELVSRAVMVVRGRRFLGQPDLRHTLDWTALGRIALAAALACVPAWAMRLVVGGGLRMVLTSMLVYGVAYLTLRLVLLRRPPAPLATPAPAHAA